MSDPKLDDIKKVEQFRDEAKFEEALAPFFGNTK